jgi:hypothetical protein
VLCFQAAFAVSAAPGPRFQTAYPQIRRNAVEFMNITGKTK